MASFFCAASRAARDVDGLARVTGKLARVAWRFPYGAGNVARMTGKFPRPAGKVASVTGKVAV